MSLVYQENTYGVFMSPIPVLAESLAPQVRSRPATGFERVYYPGELEYLRTERLRKEGVSVEDATWARLAELAREYGLDAKLGF